MPPDPPPTDDFLKDGRVPVGYAFVGEAIGLALIYAGTRIPYRILSWPAIGIGVSFILVMTAYIIATFWENASPHLRLLLARARAHVRKDPQLGTLIRDVKAGCWEGGFKVRNRSIRILIDGHRQPDPALLVRARELVADFKTIDRSVKDYLAQTAKEWAPEAPELAAEVGKLRVSGLILQPANPPGSVLIEFEGPDEDLYWSCEYANGEFGVLDYDS